MEALLNDGGRVFWLELLMVCAIATCGCYTTYTDIHFRRIANRVSWGLLAVGLVGQGVFSLWSAVELSQAGLVLGVGFVVSYALYLYGFWAPGDAKLFWAFVLVLPPTLFPATSLSSFNAPLWALLLNAFVLTCVVLLALWTVLRPSRAAEVQVGLDAAQVLHLGGELAGLLGIVLGFGAFLRAEAMTFVEVVIAVLVLYLLVDHFVPRRYRLTVVLPGLILGGYTAWESGDGLIYLVLWVVCWGAFALYRIIQRLSPRSFLQVLPIQALREGMVPRQAIPGEPEPDVLCYVGRPLTKRQVRTLHEKSADGSLAPNALEVELALPFAPIIAAAAVLTLILGGSLIQPLIELFSPLQRVLEAKL